MKIGMRKPSLKKSFKARTTGRAKRAIKRAIIPGYGKKGMGWIKNPKKAVYNKIYHKTTFGVNDIVRAASYSGGRKRRSSSNNVNRNYNTSYSNTMLKKNINKEIFELANKLGLSTKLVKKYSTIMMFTYACILLGFIVPFLLIVGIILIIVEINMYRKKEFKSQRQWYNILRMYSSNKNNKCRQLLDKLSEDEKQKPAYRTFNRLLLKSENKLQGSIITRTYDIYSEFVALSIETTGLNFDFDRIVKISAEKYRDGIVIKKFEELIDPQINIPNEISQINGITNDMVKGKADINEVMNKLIAFINNSPIVTHNAEFVIEFINANLDTSIQNKIIDTIKISKAIYPELDNYKLVAIAEMLNLSINNKCKVEAKIYLDFCNEKKEKEKLFNEIEKNIFEQIKRILIENNRDIKYLRMKRTGVYADICVFYNMFRMKCNGKKQYVLTNIDKKLLEEAGAIVDIPSKNEKYKNRVMIAGIKDFSIFKRELLSRYDECLQSLKMYVENTEDGLDDLERYLINN